MSDDLFRRLADYRSDLDAAIEAERSTALVEPIETPRGPRRRVVLAVAVTALLVGGVGLVVAANRGGPAPQSVSGVDDTTVATVPESSPGTSAAPAVTSPSSVSVSTSSPIDVPETVTAAADWTATDLGTDSPVSNLYQTFTGDGPIYGWTADERLSPGFASNFYRSDDGITWVPTATSPGAAILSATASNNRVAVLESAADVVVNVSNDAGSTWQAIPFPDDLPAIGAVDAAAIRPTAPFIAMAGETVVASFGIEQTPSPTLTPDTTVGDPVGSEPRLYVSTGGRPFVVVGGGPLASRSAAVAALTVSNNEFLALTVATSQGTESQSTLWDSPDGRTWNALGVLPANVGGATIGKVGDNYVVVPWCCDSSIWLSVDGQDWHISDFAGLLNANGQRGTLVPYAAEIGSHDITLVGMMPIAPTGDVDFVRDGVIQRLNGGSLSDISFFDGATGAELGHITGIPFDNGVVRALGDGKIDILDAAGTVRTSFTAADLAPAINSATSKQPPPEEVILHSADGSSWSKASINQITGGRPSDVAWIRSTADITTIGINVGVLEDPSNPTFHRNVLVAHYNG
jgi:hypothetical protein